MNKKRIIWVSCISIGVIILFVSCVFLANTMYKKETMAYVDKIKSEYDAKLKELNESVNKLKNDFAEISKKEQEFQQKAEEKNKEVNKKDNSTMQNKETPTPKSNQPQESPDLLKRERLNKLDKNFWATRLYYMNRNLHDAQSVARDVANDSTSSSKVKKTISEYTQNLNENYARFKEVENLGIPSVCKADYQKFKNLYSQYIKCYGSMYDEKAKTDVNTGAYNKCDSIANEIDEILMRMESKLK